MCVVYTKLLQDTIYEYSTVISLNRRSRITVRNIFDYPYIPDYLSTSEYGIIYFIYFIALVLPSNYIEETIYKKFTKLISNVSPISIVYIL